MTMVLVCTDATPPAEGAAYSACTGTVWTDSANVAPGIFDGLSMDSAATVGASVMVVLGFAFCLRQIRKQVESS